MCYCSNSSTLLASFSIWPERVITNNLFDNNMQKCSHSRGDLNTWKYQHTCLFLTIFNQTFAKTFVQSYIYYTGMWVLWDLRGYVCVHICAWVGVYHFPRKANQFGCDEVSDMRLIRVGCRRIWVRFNEKQQYRFVKRKAKLRTVFISAHSEDNFQDIESSRKLR